MRHSGLLGLLLSGVGVWCLLGLSPAPPAGVQGAVVKGLQVHEWGVFRASADLEMANADMRAIWDGLPRFVYGQLPGRTLPRHWSNIELRDRPVIFFHAAEPIALDLCVTFPGGVAGVWWPGTQWPGTHQGVPLPRGLPEETGPSRLQWRLNLKEAPRNPGQPEVIRVVDQKPVPEGHWFNTLRRVPATDVFAHVGEEDFGLERERFVYYDGLFPARQWVRISVGRERISLTSQVKHPVFDLTVVERTGDRIRVGRQAKLDAGATVKSLEMTVVDSKRWPVEGPARLTAQLKDASLTEPEAGSLVALWKDELLLTEGVTVFYRLPQAEYDRLLPLTVAPAAEKVVRVGLVLHAHCEPDLAERVARLVTDLDSDDFPTREEAHKRLERIGRAAFVQLTRLLKQNPSPEVRRRVEDILARHAVESALPRKPGRLK